MQIVIDISEGTYNRLKKRKETTLDLNIICKAVYNGTPLPKGHWIDINGDKSLWECSHCGQHSCCDGNFCNDCGAEMVEPQESEDV